MEFAVVSAWQTVGRQLRAVNRGRVLRANIFLCTGILMLLTGALVPNELLVLKLMFWGCAAGMAGIAGAVAQDAERCDGIKPFLSHGALARPRDVPLVRQSIVNA